MKRFLTVIMVTVFMLSLVACGSNKSGGASESGVKTLTIAHGASESYHLHRALISLKDELEETGNFVVELYPSSQFGNDAEMVESVKTGDLAMAIPPSSFLTDEAPEMALIELPYVFPSREAAINTLKGTWGQEQLAALEDDGLIGLGYFENGLRHLTNSRIAVRRPEDLKGLKLRTMQVPAHVFLWNDLGATAEGAPFAELYTNLSTKVFDGQENPIAHIHAQKFYEVQAYLTLTEHVYTAYVPVMGEDFWDILSQEEQEQVETAFANAFDYQLHLIEEEEADQLDEIKNNSAYPTEIIELTAEEKQAFIDAAQPTLNHYRTELGAANYDKFIQSIQEAINN